MFRRFNDISIRSKLIVIVSGAVALLTTAVLISVGVSANRQVNDDVRQELEDGRIQFSLSEGEHLHDYALEARVIASNDALVLMVQHKDQSTTCSWAENLLARKEGPIKPKDVFDLVGVVLANGKTLSISLRGKKPCGDAEMKWRFPGIANDEYQPEITNWESAGDAFYELIEAPILDDHNRDLGTLVIGFEVADSLAKHIETHTGKNAALWHVEGPSAHLLGSSDPALKPQLTREIEDGRLIAKAPCNSAKEDFCFLDASFEDPDDIVHNPQGLHIALAQPVAIKYKPFHQLVWILVGLGVMALVMGVMVGVLLSRPISNPLMSLASAAESVAQGQLDVADGLMKRNPERLGAKDEIGVLGRSFLRMVQGLKERLAMSTFLSQATYEHIRRHPESPSAISERTSMAILFSDVRQFSNFAETRDPEVVIQLLNQVLSLQAEIVNKRGGDIDKFVGDALIAWFSGEDRCQRAVSAANEMIATLQDRFQGEPGTSVGVGVHVGEVVVGSIGSSARKDYTAIGSVVNMAARLCSNAHPGQVLVSEAVKIELGTTVALQTLSPISFKGFSGPVPVFDATSQPKPTTETRRH
ncbi:MAG TPA: adenylate/guanylate cyclase domain-containing protein [Candidatus Angelobacter sp.]|nr:adenylate/guanylate cyclase domain-containing protein [Candidatus Angelobacter sp.]